MNINKNLLKIFYETYDIQPLTIPKSYFQFYEVIDSKMYPALSQEKFLQILEVLWKEQIDMNFDNECDLEQLIEYRQQSFHERVIEWLTTSGIYLDTDKQNHIEYYIKQIFKEE